MNDNAVDPVIQEYLNYIDAKEFPCIAAKAALAKSKIRCMVADHLACPKDDRAILEFLYQFVDEFRNTDNVYNSAVVIFRSPGEPQEQEFDHLMWARLQAIADLDAKNYSYDKRVSSNPADPTFSFSVKEEGFYVIGLHHYSSRKARQFHYPALVFNPHHQFETLRKTHKYEPMKKVVRSRDQKFTGSVNPMLSDFGEFSEAFQYSGRQYEKNWKCPFVSHHEKNNHSTT